MSSHHVPTHHTVLGHYRLTTAEILYHMPDHPSLLQTYVWQQYDTAPDLPLLNEFLEFWRTNLDGKLHAVRIASAALHGPVEINYADVQLTLH